MYTRAQIRSQIYSILQKDETAYGLLTPTKVNDAIQDSFDFLSTKAMKLGGGWLTSVVYCDITAESPYVDLPTGLAMVNFIKIKDSGADLYTPLQFNENWDGVTRLESESTSAYRPSYRFSSNRIYLEPTPASDIEDGILIDGVFFPEEASDSTPVSGDMNNKCFLQFVKWRAASICYSLANNGEQNPTIEKWLMEWKQACLEFIARRKRVPTTIKGIKY